MPAKFTNNASGTLASSITSGVTTIAVTTGQGALFPTLAAGEFFYATLVNSSNQLEIVRVTARSGDTLTVVRGQEGTTARAYNAADKIELRPTAAALTNMVQLDGTQTFTGTLTSSGATFSGTWAGTATFSGNVTFSNTITGSISGNAGTVTNGVYTTGDQTIAGTKTFTNSVIVQSIFLRVGTSGAGNGGNFVHRNDAGVDQWTTGLLGNAGATTYSWYNAAAAATRMSLDTSGNLTATGNVTAYSDERLKKDWDELPADFVARLAAVKSGTYTRTDTGERQVGVSAQSLQSVAPEGVMDGEYLSVSYGNVALAACVALAREVNELKRRLEV